MEGTSAPPPGSGLADTLKRLARFTAIRLFVLFVTLSVGIFLAILIANMGGKLDEIRKTQIREDVTQRINGDPVARMLPLEERNRRIAREVRLEVENRGLDRPFWQRVPSDLYGAVTLQLGRAQQLTSDSGSREVSRIILERLPSTLILFATASLLGFIAAIFGALFLSRRYGSWLDRIVVALAPASTAPSWFYGIFLILLFAFVYKWFPSEGMVSAPPPESGWVYWGSVAKHMVLPVAAMFFSRIFSSIYSYRTFFLIYSSEDYVEMARAKGVPPRAIERRYVLRPTLPTIVTNFAFMLIGLWSGAIILERVFNWPGLGTLLFQAIGHNDTPVIVASVVIYAYLLGVTVFLLDILYAILDPRIRVAGGKG